MNGNLSGIRLGAAAALVALSLHACSDAPPPGEGDAKTIEDDTASAAKGSMAEHAHTNRLINETSPYLLQHAHNPMDWYPWGPEALERAKAENKPIFLSVGYSSCHWCHVMERESFENEEIAAIANEHFIVIKVDREERPDIDEIYMAAVQAMTGSGGWPMSVFLTPDLEPFYGGTYFPPEDRFGRPGFKSVLLHIANLWDEERDEVIQNAGRLAEHMQQVLASQAGAAGVLGPEIITKAVRQLAESFDDREGGFGQAPKFPSSPSIALLLREYARTGDADTLEMATLTLDKMARGGMYDHLGGGFARYSTDEEWLVPHFEKMLYDNAQLAQVYLEAYQLTKNPFYRQIAEETLDYVLRDMRDDRGGFHSAEDADSEGEEGKFYVWSKDEIDAILGEDDSKIFCAYYNVRGRGNFSSREEYHARLNILHTGRSDEEAADDLHMTVDLLRETIARLDGEMLDVRSKRIRPGLDDKVLASWNALMITALAQGYQILGDTRYRDAAFEAATFLMTDMMSEGGLLRTHRHGESRLPAYLDDYAFTVVALMDVYEATFDPAWLDHAHVLTKRMIEKFWDTENPGFYFTSDEHKNLIVRTRSAQDSAIPSGPSMAAFGLLRLAKFIDEPEYYDKAKRLLEASHAQLSSHPRAFLKTLAAVDFMLYPPKEIAIAGTPGSPEVAALLAVAQREFVPNKVVAFIDPDAEDAAALGKRIPLLAGKTRIKNQAAAYVCRDFACNLPVTSGVELLKQLEAGDG